MRSGSSGRLRPSSRSSRRPGVDLGERRFRPDLKDGPDPPFPVHDHQVPVPVVPGPEAAFFECIRQIPDDQTVVAFGPGLPLLVAVAGADQLLVESKLVEGQLRLGESGRRPTP